MPDMLFGKKSKLPRRTLQSYRRSFKQVERDENGKIVYFHIKSCLHCYSSCNPNGKTIAEDLCDLENEKTKE